MAAEIERLPADGERCVVVAWPLGEDGRKLYAGTALLDEHSELLARARQTWIAPRQP
jgi:predicted amidohydrolase